MKTFFWWSSLKFFNLTAASDNKLSKSAFLLRYRISGFNHFIMQIFTPEELIQYLYGEATQEMVLAIETALQVDWSLQEKLAVLKESQQQLGTIKLEQPRKEAIAAILNYAQQTAEVIQ
jgi:hypothetical protein